MTSDSQKTKAPAITAFAMAVGNRRCANRVIGYERNVNKAGGMTSLSLWHALANVTVARSAEVDRPVHGKIVVDSVREEVDGEKDVVIRQIIVDMEEETVEQVLQEGPDEVPKEEA